MDRFETTKYYQRCSPLKGIAYGAIGGVAAGFVMAPFLVASAAIIGLPTNSIFVAYGLTLSTQADNARIIGIGMHFLTSTLIGVIFGTITSIVDSLRITGIGKGIVEGLVTGMMAFAILFVPISVLVLPPFLTQALVIETELGVEEQGQAVDMLEQLMPALIGLSIGDHLIYGVVLGTVMSALVVGVRKRTKENAHIDGNMSVERGEHFQSEQQHICPECQKQFETVEELEEHCRTLHYSGAAA